MNQKQNKITFWVGLALIAAALIAGIVFLSSAIHTSKNTNFLGISISFIVLIFGFCFLFSSIRQKKQYAMISAFLQQHAGENAVYLTGSYRKAGERGKAVAKTTASVLGGILSAIFLGVGFYKVYNADTPMGYVLCDSGLFFFNLNEPLIEGNVPFIAKGSLYEPDIRIKKRQVTLTNLQTNEIFIFNMTNKDVTSEQIGERLKSLVYAEPEKKSVSASQPNAPFEELASPAPNAETTATAADPSASSTAESDADARTDAESIQSK